MVAAQRLTEAEYREFALHDDHTTWELWDGVPREKPLMSMMHGDVTSDLGHDLRLQLDRRQFRVHYNHAKTRISARNYYIPDVAVIPAGWVTPYLDDPRAIDAYSEPLPLVVEIWSPSTGNYDFAIKLDGYRDRGDEEIWYLHPNDRALTVWRRQADGSYAEAVYTGGVVPVVSLPGVAIDLDALLDG